MNTRRPLHISLLGLGLALALPACGDDKTSAPGTKETPAEADCSDGKDNDADGVTDCDDLDCRMAGKTCELAPQLDRTVVTTVWEAAQFLFQGKDALQKDTSAKAFSKKRIAILRGKLVDRDGEPLSGVRVAIAEHKEWGYTVSRPDGAFDMAVEGGSQLLVQFSREGYLTAERGVQAAWRSYEAVPEVGLIETGTAVTKIAGNADREQVAVGDVVEDQFGRRQAIIVFPKETTATARLADGETQELDRLHVRLAEYPLGLPSANTLDEPARFAPGSSPQVGSLSWGIEATIDQAQELGASTVEFSTPVGIVIENFLKLPVGSPVPVGYYQRGKGNWQGENAGRVIEVLGVTDGEADIDIDGDGEAEDDDALRELHIYHGTRREIARRYEPGTTLWHVPVEHFSPHSADFPSVVPPNRQAPIVSTPLVRSIDEPTRRGSVVVERQGVAQAFGLGLAGTPYSLHYQSDRTTEYRKGFTIELPVVGSEVPEGLKRVSVTVRIAGQTISQDFEPSADLKADLKWDGKDALGRVVQGQQRARITLSYVYDGELRPAETFGATSRLAVTEAEDGVGGVTVESSLTRRFSITVGTFDASGYQLGGLGFDVLHAFDPDTGKIYFGWGDDRSAENVALVTTRPAGDAVLGTPDGVFAAPDGSVLVSQDDERQGDLGRLVRIEPNGDVTFVVGGDAPGDAADLLLGSPQGIAMKSDGSIIVNDFLLDAIREIAPDGSVRTLIGRADDEQGTPEIEANLESLDGLALGLREELYIINGDEVLKLEGGALTSFAGTGEKPTDNDVLEGDGAPALTVPLNTPSGVAVGADGSVFISERDGARIRRVTPDGIMRTFAGTGVPGFSGDGDRAAAAQLNDPRGLAVAADGSLYVADQLNDRIRRITPDGFIQTVVGGGDAELAEGQLPTKIKLDKPDGISIASDGALYIATGTTVYKVAPGIGELANTNDSIVPSEDGRTLYRFDNRGKHTETINAMTGVTELAFGYDDAGLLISIKDKSSLTTNIERDDEGLATAIVSPFGQRTKLEIEDGNLQSITDPLERTVSLEYTDDGLLSKVVSPAGAERTFEYDEEGQGLIRKITEPSGYFEKFEAPKLPESTSLTARVTALIAETPTGSQVKYTTTQDSGVIHRLIEALDLEPVSSTDRITEVPMQLVDGTRVVKNFDADSGFGSQVLIPIAETITTPNGRTLEKTFTEIKTLDDIDNLLSATLWRNETLINGKVTETTYDRSDRSIVTRSPMGRVRAATQDDLGRVTDEEAAGFGSSHFEYDSFGRIVSVTHSAGDETRTKSYSYGDEDGFLRSVTDALDRKTSFEPDLAGRLLALTDPSGARYEQTLDDDNNLTLLTLPGKREHAFKYREPSSLLEEMKPPFVGESGATNLDIGNVRFSYNDENLPTLLERSDGIDIALGYDEGKRVKSLDAAGVKLTYAYDRAGRATRVTRSDGPTLDVSFDGRLPTGSEWSGPVEGKVTFGYDADLRPFQITVNDASTVTYGFDDDGAIISATGNQQTLDVIRAPESGLVTGTSLGVVDTAQEHNGFGEVIKLSADFQRPNAYTQTLTRDGLGRIVQVDETFATQPSTTQYGYDAAGRLESVTRGDTVTSYEYDDAGNRTAILVNGETTVSAEYDAQDRILSHGDVTFEQTEHGDLLRRSGPAGALELSYDGVGGLQSATVTTAKTTTAIDYTLDGMGRRVGKQVGGQFKRAWLYRDQLRPVAEITDGGVFTHFVYATQDQGAPDFMLRAGVPYRLIKDHLGSVRFVVNAVSGLVEQLIEYDEFGNIKDDSRPGFQPFGFAGGLYDPDTGLVRFGVRDYDPSVGRWLSRDPFQFGAGQTNLYAYAANDPINITDYAGRWGIALGIGGGIAFGPLLFGYGGEASTGIVIDFSNPNVSWFTSTGHGAALVSELSAGVSLQGSYVHDVDKFWGTGTEVGVNTPFNPVGGGALNFSTPALNGPQTFNGVTLSGGIGTGTDVHYFDTDTTEIVSWKGMVAAWERFKGLPGPGARRWGP